MREISICIPTWQRTDLLFECFEKVKGNDNITEIVIVDDASDWKIWEEIQERAKDNPKIKLFRNDVNLDCYANKHRSIELASNQWCCLWDSDNVFDFGYLYSLFQILDWKKDTIYTPDFAMPTFSFQQFSGLLITKGNVAGWVDAPMFSTMLNAANYFVNRDEYLRVWDGSGIDPVTSDSIFTTYNWLAAGNKIQVVDGLHYQHRIHPHGHYNNNVARTPAGFHESILNKLRNLT